MTLVLINKTGRDVTVALRVRDRFEYAFAHVRRLTGSSPQAYNDANASMTVRNGVVLTLPAFSVNAVVLMPYL